MFQELSFYNVPIKKPRIKHLKLHELQLYDINFIIFHFTKLSIKQISKAFKGYAKRYKIKIIDSKDALVQLEASKSSTEDLFKDLLDEIKGCKYQITVKVLLKKNTKEMEI